jgi:hypothetical protein
LKTVIVARDGSLSVADSLAEMQAWLAEHHITAIELTMVHVLNLQIVFRATFEEHHDAEQFAAQFG